MTVMHRGGIKNHLPKLAVATSLALGALLGWWIDTADQALAAGLGALLVVLLFSLLIDFKTISTPTSASVNSAADSPPQSAKTTQASVVQTQSIKAATTLAAMELKQQNENLDNTKKAVLNILEDLEEEKTKLVELTQRDKALIYSIGDSIIVTDEYGQITRVNTALETMVGYPETELVGKGINAAIHIKTVDGQDVPPDKRVVFEALATGKPMHASYQIIRKDQATFIGDMTAAPYIINNRPAGAVVTIRDVSQQVAIDKAKTEFVSLASHQLRTPLSTINWYLEMVLGGDVGAVTEEQKKYLSEVYAANQRMVTLVNSLLNVSRIDLGTFAIEPEPTDLKKTVTNVLNELQGPIHTRKMHIVTNFADNLKPYSADPKLIHIIFQNLISNAVKYTPAGGQIITTITTDHDHLLISVADNGYGIPKAQQSKIFTKLFRADNVIAKDTDGTGLGLYLIKAIAEEAGGSIAFVSQEDVGTTFTIKLPLAGMKRRAGTKGLSAVAAG